MSAAPQLISKTSAAWPGLKAWVLEQIAQAHVQLERTDLSEAEHNATRGQIQAWRDLIRFVEPVEVHAPLLGGYFDTTPSS